MAADANHSDVFDAMTPEGSYELNLAKQYDQIVLQNLLSLSQEVAELSALNPSEAFEQKSCFQSVKYNGKSSWSPPTEKTSIGLWKLDGMETGTLTFNFTLDPNAYKKEMA